MSGRLGDTVYAKLSSTPLVGVLRCVICLLVGMSALFDHVPTDLPTRITACPPDELRGATG